MSSLLTNVSALTALQSLSMTQKALQTTQSQISTGLKVSSAADNAAVWSTAQTMQSDNGALGAVSSALAYSGSMLDTFTSALQQSITVTNNIKNDLVSAQQPGADLTKIQTDIAAQQSELTSIAKSATFNGTNWLANDTTTNGTTASLVASYSGGAVGFLTVNTAATNLVDTNATTAGSASDTGILTKKGAAATGVSVTTLDVTSLGGSTLANMLTDVNTALAGLDTAAATIGSARSNVTTQSTFISSLQNSLTAGVGSMVDADMNAASTRLQALQTQQSLGVQSLSIANQNTSMIMKLFGG
eukprot:gene7301-7372_t